MHEEEFLTVVDESDSVTGKADWHEVHGRGLLHRSAGIIIFEDESMRKILVQRRSAKVQESGKLECLGGHVAYDNSYMETARRELKEEVFSGRDMPELNFERLFKMRINDMPKNHEFVEIFEVIYPGSFFPNFDEVEEVFFVEVKKLVKDMEENPKRYTNFFCLVLKEMKRRRLVE